MLSGVARVTAFGAAKFAVRVQVDPDAMVARDIGFPTADLSRAMLHQPSRSAGSTALQSVTLKTTPDRGVRLRATRVRLRDMVESYIKADFENAMSGTARLPWPVILLPKGSCTSPAPASTMPWPTRRRARCATLKGMRPERLVELEGRDPGTRRQR